jgi:dolichol kinase
VLLTLKTEILGWCFIYVQQGRREGSNGNGVLIYNLKTSFVFLHVHRAMQSESILNKTHRKREKIININLYIYIYIYIYIYLFIYLSDPGITHHQVASKTLQ